MIIFFNFFFVLASVVQSGTKIVFLRIQPGTQALSSMRGRIRIIKRSPLFSYHFSNAANSIFLVWLGAAKFASAKVSNVFMKSPKIFFISK